LEELAVSGMSVNLEVRNVGEFYLTPAHMPEDHHCENLKPNIAVGAV